MHPGSEHTKNTGVNWNTGKHRRKFLRVKGSYTNDLKDNNLLTTNNLCFWGEWEAQSKVSILNTETTDHKPKYLFVPYYRHYTNNKKCNTDPFVFGDQYYYSVCKQQRYPSLRSLQSKDILLFGSNKKNNFILDSVFVIKDVIKYNKTNYQKLVELTSQTFFDVVINPIFKNENKCNTNSKTTCNSTLKAEYYLYTAVMHSDRNEFDGMFSYTPSSPLSKNDLGFERPILKDKKYISDKLKQGIKITGIEDIRDEWEKITKEILQSDLSLKIKSELPKRK